MAVEVQIQARDMTVTPHLRDYIEKKVSKLDRYLPTISEARMDLAEVKSARSAADRQVAQLTVHTRGVVLRAEERKDDIFAAVDAVLDKINRQIERYKGKRWRGRGNGATADTISLAEEPEALSADVPEPDEPETIVRRKQFIVTPMNEAEAIEQMQLLGHDNFFVFYNADTNHINVLYRRHNGNFGLIEPEIG
jgi:putative sigma-54 modulation protein